MQMLTVTLWPRSEWLTRVWDDEEEAPSLESLQEASPGSMGFPPAEHAFWRRDDVPAVVGKAGEASATSYLLFRPWD